MAAYSHHESADYAGWDNSEFAYFNGSYRAGCGTAGFRHATGHADWDYILTTKPNKLVVEIHDRMPLILPRESFEAWLDPATDGAKLKTLMVPYPTDRMEAVRVGPAVNKVAKSGPECLEPAPEYHRTTQKKLSASNIRSAVEVAQMASLRLVAIDASVLAAFRESPAALVSAVGASLGPADEGIVPILEQTVALLAAKPRAPEWGGFLAVDDAAGLVVGACGYKDGPAANGSVEVAYCTFPSFETMPPPRVPETQPTEELNESNIEVFDPTESEEDAEAFEADVFENNKDLGFVRYLDIELLGAAWQDLDAALMSDLALQMAEGEKVLLRNHKSGITSQMLFGLARRIALEKRDNDSLERLNKVPAGNSPTPASEPKPMNGRTPLNPAAMFSVEDSSPEQFAEVHGAVEKITRLKLAEDVAGLKELVSSNEDSGLPPAQADFLRKLIGDASENYYSTESTHSISTNSMADVLRSLSAISGGNESNRNEVRSRVAAGAWTVLWGVNINEAEYAKFLVAAAASVASGNPGAIAKYIYDYAERTWIKVKAAFPGAVKTAVIGFILRAIKSGGSATKFGKVGVKAGVATYQRWYFVSARVLDGTEKYKIRGPLGSWTWGWRAKYKTVQRKVKLPNHHTPYVAFRI